MDINTTTIVAMPIWWPNDIFIGVFFGLLGLCGAAIMVYLGEWEKLLGKSARMLEIEDEIESKRKIANKIKDTGEVEKRKKWEDMINENEDRLERERKSVRIQGLILYLFIGGVMAAILANGVVEAVAFGAGWTGFIGMFGIKNDSDERRKRRDEIDKEDREYLETLPEKIQEVYNRGRSDGAEEIVEKIAKIENTTVKEIIKKFE